MAGYATQTKTSVAHSKAEIEDTLSRFGIREIGTFSEESAAVILFKHAGRPYSIRISLPDKDAEEFRFTPARRFERTAQETCAAWEQACRVKWRELALLIKAKLVAISNETASFDDEFLAYAMLPNRRTVGDWAADQLSEMQSSGEMPELLPRGQTALAATNK